MQLTWRLKKLHIKTVGWNSQRSLDEAELAERNPGSFPEVVGRVDERTTRPIQGQLAALHKLVK